MFKKIIALLCSISLIGAESVFAAGGGFLFGESSENLIFSGSAQNHFLVLSSDGVVSAFGANESGQCGLEVCDETSEINYIDFSSKIVSVKAGNGFSLALDENGDVWGWGSAQNGCIGVGDDEAIITVPRKIVGLKKIKVIEVGENFSIMLTSDGDVLISGESGFSQLDLENESSVKSVSVRDNHILALCDDDSIYEFFYNEDARMIDTSEIVGKVTGIFAGKSHGVILAQDSDMRKIYTFGSNDKLQLGVEGLEKSDIPVCVLELEEGFGKNIVVNTGDYSTVIDVFDELSNMDYVDEYKFGTGISGCGEDEIDSSAVVQSSQADHVVIAIGDDVTMAYKNDDSIEFYGNDTQTVSCGIIQPLNTEAVYMHQHNQAEYYEAAVNFIKLNSEGFASQKSDYDYWEFVNENSFKYKIKNDNIFAGGEYSLGFVRLVTEATGENRTVGAIGEKIYNFSRFREFYNGASKKIMHGNEDGEIIEISALTLKFRNESVPLCVPNETSVYFKSPNEISGDTALGFYIYDLPDGVTGELVGIEDNVIRIKLIGNSTDDLDYDTSFTCCYVYNTENSEAKGTIKEYDLSKISANPVTVSRFSFLADKNDNEVLKITASLEKGKENGKKIKTEILGGKFAKNLTAENWNIDGCDELAIASVERIDDNNAIVTISGNSKDKYKSAKIRLVLQASEYTDSRIYDKENDVYISSELVSDYITVNKQNKTISSGGSSSSKKNNVQQIVVQDKKIGAVLRKNSEDIKYIKGFGKKFEPDRFITRYEVLEAVYKLFEIYASDKQSEFRDVPQQYKELVDLFFASELAQGYPDNTFRGENGITRAEFIKILSDVLKYQNPNTSSNIKFSDISKHWCGAYIAYFSTLGYINGYPDGTFRPDEKITRAEAIAILNRIAGKKTNTAFETVFDDVTESHWAYSDIYQACE